MTPASVTPIKRMTQKSGTRLIIAAPAPVTFFTPEPPATAVVQRSTIVGVRASPTTRIKSRAMIPLRSLFSGEAKEIPYPNS